MPVKPCIYWVSASPLGGSCVSSFSGSPSVRGFYFCYFTDAFRSCAGQLPEIPQTGVNSRFFRISKIVAGPDPGDRARSTDQQANNTCKIYLLPLNILFSLLLSPVPPINILYLFLIPILDYINIIYYFFIFIFNIINDNYY